MKRELVQLAILGGGPAGLAAGMFARENGLDVTLWEATDVVGGNCRTLRQGSFAFDTGAHRFHDKDPKATAVVKALLGDKLVPVDRTSHIYDDGRFLRFPLAPLDLARRLGPAGTVRAGLSFLKGRFAPRSKRDSFEAVALRAYGRFLCERFLFNYSTKLWGAPCAELASSVSGARLKGLNLRSAVIEATLGFRGKSRHLDGAFLYPRGGYGSIGDAMAERLGWDNIRLSGRITRVRHKDRRINSIIVNDAEEVAVDHVASSLPLGVLIKSLDPAPGEDCLRLAARLRFRHLRLVAFFVDRPRLSESGTVYFPDASLPFTRGYEPKNRSDAMAPEGQTSFVVEIPCFDTDPAWSSDDTAIAAQTLETLAGLGMLDPKEVLGTYAVRIPNAYPVLTHEAVEATQTLIDHLAQFRNLSLLGRNGTFVYCHAHDVIRQAHDVVQGLDVKGE